MSDNAEILVHWRAGRGIREIARSLGYARNTIRERVAVATAAGFTQQGSSLSAAQWRAALAATALECGDTQRRFPAQSKIDPLREQVTEALKASTAATVWQRLHDAGELDVGRRTFQRYVQEQIRRVDPARLTVLLPDPVFGEAMELDYGRLGLWTDPLGGRRRTVWAFVATLRASNTHFVRPVLQMDQHTWTLCHREALRFFGGVPRRWICDNLKTGVLKSDLYDPQFNRGYRECAEHYGALIDPARAVHPKDKPRVERAMPYVRDSFWSGRSFASFDAIVEAAATWCRDVAPGRRHPRLGQSVGEVFTERERPALLPLPTTPFEIVEWRQAKVHPDCHVAIQRVLYSVPWAHVGKTLEVRVGERLVQLFDGSELVKTHVRTHAGRRTDHADLPPDKAAFLMRTPAWCRREAARVGSGAAALVDALLFEGGLTRLREVQALLRLEATYGPQRLERACALAGTADGRMKTVRNLLRDGREGGRAGEPATAAALPAYLHGQDQLFREAAQ